MLMRSFCCTLLHLCEAFRQETARTLRRLTVWHRVLADHAAAPHATAHAGKAQSLRCTHEVRVSTSAAVSARVGAS